MTTCSKYMHRAYYNLPPVVVHAHAVVVKTSKHFCVTNIVKLTTYIHAFMRV